MPPVRVAEIPSLPQTRVGMPAMSQAAAAAPAKALGSLAQSIADVAAPFAEIGDKIQSAENARQLSETRNTLDEARNQHFIDLQTVTDPAEHVRLTQDFLTQQKGLVENPEFSPEVRDRLVPYFDQWATDTRTTVASNAAKLGRERSMLAMENELQHAEQANDPHRAEAVVREKVDAGLILPEEGEQMLGDLQARFTFNSLTKSIEADPIGAQEQLADPNFLERYPSLSAQDANRLQSYAARSANAARADLWNDTLNAALDGNVLSQDDLKELADSGQITAQQRASYARTYYGSAAPEYNPAIYEAAYDAMMSYTPGNDPMGAGLASLRAELATLPLPAEHIRELQGRLNDRVDPDNRTSHRLQGDFSTITKERFDDGQFGQWFALGDHDNNPATAPRQVINREDFEAATMKKRSFLDAWDSFLGAAPDDLSSEEALQTYNALFERMVLEGDDFNLLDDLAPGVDYGPAIDAILDPGIDGSVLPPKPAPTFGGQLIRDAGSFYKGSKVTVFGGSADPVDNGQSAFGGSTGKGGKEGAAIPADVLRNTFPGKDKEWFGKNVRVVVRTQQGGTYVLPLADLGTAEHIWERNRRPVLDVTPGALRAIGGVPLYKDGKLAGVQGIGDVSFALTTVDSGMPLEGATWDDVWARWFDHVRPTSASEVEISLQALLHAHAEANVGNE